MDTEKRHYILKNTVYYGDIFIEQISGFKKISMSKSTIIDESCSFLPEDDKACLLKDNHATTEPELAWLGECLKLISEISACSNINNSIDYEAVESELGIKLPLEIKVLYSIISNNKNLQKNKLVENKEGFLPINELYVEEGMLVFYKIKRTPVGISLENRQLMNYYKKEWICEEGGSSFYSFVIMKVLCNAISSMDFIMNGKVSGKLRTVLKPKKMLEEVFKDKLKIMNQYDNYGHVVMYNVDGALAWFRQNGFYGNIIVGCRSKELSKMIHEVNEGIQWA